MILLTIAFLLGALLGAVARLGIEVYRYVRNRCK